MSLKNLETVLHRSLIPASLLRSFGAQWGRSSISAWPNSQHTVNVWVRRTAHRQKLSLEILCCCCRGEKRGWCKQTNTSDPQAPSLTGRLAWIQFKSLMCIFASRLNPNRRFWSKRSSKWCSEVGEHLSVYISFGADMEFLRITNPSWALMKWNLSRDLMRSEHLASRIWLIAEPSRSGAPSRVPSLGLMILKPPKVLLRQSGSFVMTSHLLTFKLRPISAALVSIMR